MSDEVKMDIDIMFIEVFTSYPSSRLRLSSTIETHMPISGGLKPTLIYNAHTLWR